MIRNPVLTFEPFTFLLSFVIALALRFSSDHVEDSQNIARAVRCAPHCSRFQLTAAYAAIVVRKSSTSHIIWEITFTLTSP